MSLQIGLRARVAVNLAAAVSITCALLALSSVVIVRDEAQLIGRDAAERLASVVAAEIGACATLACRASVAARAHEAGGVEVEILEGTALGASRIVAPSARRAAHFVVDRAAGPQVVRVRAPYGPVRERAQAAAGRILFYLVLDGVVLVVLATLLIGRGVVRRLARVDEAIARVERLELDTPLLMEEGDEIGRMAGTVRRMVERLRDDKLRKEAYIAELEQANRALTETREGLARSEKLATVGRLAAGVAHEIGNPVAAILGYLDILRMRKASAPGEYLERIERETRRVDRIVRDLLDFARPRDLVTGPISVEAVIAAATRLVTPQPKWHSMTLAVEIAPGLPAVLGQEHYATQVLVNLLINAAEACGGRGQVRLSARAKGDTQLEVTVEDDGPGISPEQLSRLFEPFFTTKAPGEGTGLGLAISHRLMESFGGSLGAANREGGGAVFTLRFQAVA